MIKELLDWNSSEVVNIYDEVTLWSAPFGRLLLENIPMRMGATVMDIGFGTGFPLLELSQRFGSQSKIYGVDIWEEGIRRTKEKIRVMGLQNIVILEESASKIALEDNQVDIITSNLGVNNFSEKVQVYREIKRVLKKGGKLCITTNPEGTFQELFAIFEEIMTEMKMNDGLIALNKYIEHRSSKESIINEIEAVGLSLVQSKEDATFMRFMDGEALLNHGLIRIGFRESWENMIGEDHKKEFFKRLIKRINDRVAASGSFQMSIPMLYLEFEK